MYFERTKAIDCSDLKEGDALVTVQRGHIILFAKWNNSEKTQLVAYEESVSIH